MGPFDGPRRPALDFLSANRYDERIRMTIEIPRRTAVFGAAMVLCLVFACCGRKDDRTLIFVLVERIGHLVEEKDTKGLMGLLDEGYRDFEKRDKPQTEEMVGDYFRDYRGIVMHILGTRIYENKGGEASVQTEIVLSSGAAKVFRKLFKAFGDFYRFDIQLRKTGDEWRIFYVKWENVRLDDLSPESLSLVKKIFPGI